TCTHRSLSTSTRIAPGFSSQEPRRPRFSFFNLHNVKEPTSLPNGLGRRRRTRSPHSLRERDLVSGCSADRLPCQKPLISGSGKRSRRQRWRVVFETFPS